MNLRYIHSTANKTKNKANGNWHECPDLIQKVSLHDVVLSHVGCERIQGMWTGFLLLHKILRAHF